jgi:IS30 family transposase
MRILVSTFEAGALDSDVRAADLPQKWGRLQNRTGAMAWSPLQIANRVRLDYPEDTTMRISNEAINQALYVQGREALKRELMQCLRTRRALRARSRGRGKSLSLPRSS